MRQPQIVTVQIFPCPVKPCQFTVTCILIRDIVSLYYPAGKGEALCLPFQREPADKYHPAACHIIYVLQ